MRWQGAKKAITQASTLYMTTPNPDEARGGGYNNNNLIAMGVEAGKILNAVWNQPEDQKCWLLYAYSELFTTSDVRALALHCTAKVLHDYQLTYGPIKPKKIVKFKTAISRAIVDFKQRSNSGTAMSIKELAFELCLVNHWNRDFSKIHRLTHRYLDQLDKDGLAPVVEVLESLKSKAA